MQSAGSDMRPRTQVDMHMLYTERIKEIIAERDEQCPPQPPRNKQTNKQPTKPVGIPISSRTDDGRYASHAPRRDARRADGGRVRYCGGAAAVSIAAAVAQGSLG